MSADSAPHVIVVDDKSSMWGNVIRVVGPYPSRDAALMDKARVSDLYPKRAFIEVSAMEPGKFHAPPKMAAKSKPKTRDMSGTAFCSVCGVKAVHERGPGTPLVIRHTPECPEGQR